MDDKNKMSTKKKGGFIGLVGALAAAIATPIIMNWEGTEYVGYRDIVGVATKCTGDTNDVIVGKIYTKAECDASLEKQLIRHAEPVLKCTPILKDKPHQLAAAISLAYNIGPNAYCRSTVAKRFSEGRWQSACDNFLAWRYAGGRVVKGLVNRRNAERKICMTNLPKG